MACLPFQPRFGKESEISLSDEETHIMLLEPKSALNTGNIESERTVRELERI